MLQTAELVHPASDPAFRPTPGASLPGTLASPRTGLAPAGFRELVAQIVTSWANFLPTRRPNFLDAPNICSIVADPGPLGVGPAGSPGTRFTRSICEIAPYRSGRANDRS